MADPVEIHRVLMNLCTNAYHAKGEDEGVAADEINPRGGATKNMFESLADT